MGCFGYMCKGCNSNIRSYQLTNEFNWENFRGGENCILIHVRDGTEVGRCEGHYNSYGTIFEEQDKLMGFRSDNDDNYINSHEQLCKDEFNDNPRSGIAAWHKICYEQAIEAEKTDLTPSIQDDNQSWGNPRTEDELEIISEIKHNIFDINKISVERITSEVLYYVFENFLGSKDFWEGKWIFRRNAAGVSDDAPQAFRFKRRRHIGSNAA